MPTKRLPNNANFDHLKHQAKDMLCDFRAGRLSAFQRAREFHPKLHGVSDAELSSRTFRLSDAQLCIAREYGYQSWPRLKTVVAQNHQVELDLNHNDRIEDGPFKQALDFMDEGDEARLIQHLAAHPDLINQSVTFEGGNYFHNPSLLEFVPENPIRQGSLPENAVQIAEILLKAGAQTNQKALNETLMLAASGRVCREFGIQTPLLRLLMQYGAEPTEAMHSALAHGEFQAAEVLLENGAPLTLSAVAALNRIEDVKRLVAEAPELQKRLALAHAATHGWAEVITVLLSAGADPNRYNPPGGHSHCTALHSAAFAGHFSAVKALVAGGARWDIPDIHHHMSALGWAKYSKQDEVVAYLLSRSQPMS
ncbi:MAG: ankyrin repeat domain-containing protein [Pseudomonadota bacterium]|nr:ankyrin repeat domain-containing protein [Pseudomonadota bacterium]